ncbi:hypothetical protein GCM10007857_85850 [Bradyrhizobium iriomotense]|uniref:Uncharacterized protein n=1 Tax=Bradyrhizobium iriomotense TaxID=441950 RepID=A0ABQ6BC00_9BRAD|nr:hypothetical protein GCM10007857_85850 [Bradyrhizobium iriomotense]
MKSLGPPNEEGTQKKGRHDHLRKGVVTHHSARWGTCLPAVGALKENPSAPLVLA